jgi:hypothetical protein
MRHVPAAARLAAIVAVLAAACATRPDDGKPTWALSGQSNAENLAKFLTPYAHVVGFSKTSTAIDEWAPGRPMWMRLAPTLGGAAAAFIWWQGESNNNDPPGSYRAKLADLAARVRAASHRPDLLFVVIRVGPNYRPPGCNIWDEQQAFVAHDPHAVLVPSDDLEFVDFIHMTDNGYRQMAARIAQTLHADARP